MYAPFQPSSYVQGGRTMTTEVSGRDRVKFFKRPVVPTIEAGAQAGGPGFALTAKPTIHRALQPKSHVLQADAAGSLVSRPPRQLAGLERKPRAAGAYQPDMVGAVAADGSGVAAEDTRDASCQTMMRENECQTDPYTPDYFVEDGSDPEVLAIKDDVRWGAGLPAGLGEVELIDTLQRRKQVESELPTGMDPKSIKSRLHALESLEKAEWEAREDKIKQQQEARLGKIDDALRRREAKREEASKDRVELLKKAKLADVEQQLQKLQERRLVTTRKLTVKHANPTCDKTRRDIIEAHASYGPASHAVKSNALVEKVNTTNYDVRPTLLSFPEGLAELEKTKAEKLATVKEEKLVPPQDKAIANLATNFQKRQAKTVAEHLEYANKIIDESKAEKQKQQSVQDLYRATPRLKRPDTPHLQLLGDEDEEREEAMLLLQRLLRGRAVQNDFFEGKERCHGLIAELQAANKAHHDFEHWKPEKEKEMAEAQQQDAVDSAVDEAQGDIIFGTLDYLHKELRRQREAAKVDRLRQLAEATRAEREAAERKRRADEEAQRAKEEWQYNALVRSTDATVETFLDQLLLKSVREAAKSQALAERLRPVEPPKLDTPLEKENYVCDLLEQFLIPLVSERVDDKEAERTKALAEGATFGVLDMLKKV